MRDDRQSARQVKKISISLSDDVLEWACNNEEGLKVSTFINKVLRERMQSGGPCDACAGLGRLEHRIDKLEKAIKKYRVPRVARAIGSVTASTRPADVFGELTHIKNVSAENASAVMNELVPFMKRRDIVYRDLVLQELFPKTRSTITNDINYWYNACKGVIDHLIERGYVAKAGKGKYRWVGNKE